VRTVHAKQTSITRTQKGYNDIEVFSSWRPKAKKHAGDRSYQQMMLGLLTHITF